MPRLKRREASHHSLHEVLHVQVVVQEALTSQRQLGIAMNTPVDMPVYSTNADTSR
jgi:hypothetical protein